MSAKALQNISLQLLATSSAGESKLANAASMLPKLVMPIRQALCTIQPLLCRSLKFKSAMNLDAATAAVFPVLTQSWRPCVQTIKIL